jgi:hypothetical protein
MSLGLAVRTSLVSGLMVALPAFAASTVFPVATTEQLVEAIQRANETPEADVITLERALYVLDGVHAPDQGAALPAITTAIVIRGNGAELRRYSVDNFRIFSVAAEGHLRLERITLAEGSLGAIRNYGKTELRHVHLVDNTANGAQAIVENHGEMAIESCDVSFNTIAGAQRDVGTIVNWGQLTLSATTFEGNLLSRRYPGVALASSVLNYGHSRITDVVIAENTAGDEQGTGAPQAPLVNLGNGRLDLKRVRERDNLPGAALVAGSPGE